MNKEEIILEKISYEELQDKYINESTTNYVLEKQNNRLQQENKQLKERISKALEFIKKYNIYWDDDYRINNAYIPKELKQILEGEK